jgi:hypothetical protein
VNEAIFALTAACSQSESGDGLARVQRRRHPALAAPYPHPLFLPVLGSYAARLAIVAVFLGAGR